MADSSPVSTQELDLIKATLDSHGCDPIDSTTFSCWAQITFDVEKAKYSKKLLAVSLYRILIFKTNFFGKMGIEKDIHLWDVDSIQEMKGKVLVMTVSKYNLEIGIQVSDVVGFLTSIRRSYRLFSTGVKEALKMKMNVYKELLEELEPLQEGQISEGCGIVNAYLSYCNYVSKPSKECMMRYLNDLAVRQVEDLVLDDCPSHSLGGAGGQPSSSGVGLSSSAYSAGTELLVDFQPLFLALSHNTFFTSVTGEYIQIDQASTDALGTAIATNSHLTRIELIGCGISDISILGNSLKSNCNFHQLSILNLSKNSISEKGGLALASGIEACVMHSLQILALQDCKLSAKVMQALFESFHTNLFLSLSIQSLFIGGNDYNELALQSMNRWAKRGSGQFHLERISLAKSSGINADLLFSALSSLTCRLRWLDLSGIRLGNNERIAVENFVPNLKQASRPIPSKEFFDQTNSSSSSSNDLSSMQPCRIPMGLVSYANQSLTVEEEDELPTRIGATLADMSMNLILRQCQLSLDMVAESLIPSLKKNGDLSRICLDLSQNDIPNSAFTMLTQMLSDCPQIISLKISEMKLRLRTCINFMAKPPPMLVRLDLSSSLTSNSSSSSTPGELTEFATSVCSFISSSKTLTHLSLANNRYFCTPKVLSQILLSLTPSQPLSQTKSLPNLLFSSSMNPLSSSSSAHPPTIISSQIAPIKFLDLSDNNGGDHLAHSIGILLRTNRTIQSLRIDGNNISYCGWQSIYAGMTEPSNPNHALWDLPLPSTDLLKATKYIPLARRSIFLAIIANLKSILDKNTPNAVLKQYLVQALNATPIIPWPSILQVSAAPNITQDPSANPAATTGTVPAHDQSSPSSSYNNTALTNPRATMNVTPTRTSLGTKRTLALGTMSRNTMMIDSAMLQQLLGNEASKPVGSNNIPSENQEKSNARIRKREIEFPSGEEFFNVAKGTIRSANQLAQMQDQQQQQQESPSTIDEFSAPTTDGSSTAPEHPPPVPVPALNLLPPPVARSRPPPPPPAAAAANDPNNLINDFVEISTSDGPSITPPPISDSSNYTLPSYSSDSTPTTPDVTASPPLVVSPRKRPAPPIAPPRKTGAMPPSTSSGMPTLPVPHPRPSAFTNLPPPPLTQAAVEAASVNSTSEEPS